MNGFVRLAIKGFVRLAIKGFVVWIQDGQCLRIMDDQWINNNRWLFRKWHDTGAKEKRAHVEKYRMRGLNSRPLACEASVITTTPTRPALCFHFHLMTPAPSISHPTQMTTAHTWYPCSCPDCPHRYYYCPQTRRVKWHLESGDSVNYFSSFRSSHVRSAIFYISYELPSGVFLHAALCQRQLSVSIQ